MTTWSHDICHYALRGSWQFCLEFISLHKWSEWAKAMKELSIVKGINCHTEINLHIGMQNVHVFESKKWNNFWSAVWHKLKFSGFAQISRRIPPGAQRQWQTESLAQGHLGLWDERKHRPARRNWLSRDLWAWFCLTFVSLGDLERSGTTAIKLYCYKW